MQNFKPNSLIYFLNTRKRLNQLKQKEFLYFFDIFWSIIKLKDDFCVVFFGTFWSFWLFWYITVKKNVILEVKMPKTMIDFDRQFY